MRLDDAIEHVGEPRFRAACDAAWRTAIGTGEVGHGGSPAALGDLPHELADPIWFDGDASMAARLAVAQELYRAMPCYANLMYFRYADFGPDERAAHWAEYRSLLGDPSRQLGDPVAYSLWVDYFEDPETVEDAWRQMSPLQEPWETRLSRLLEVSGPVLWTLKAPTYEHLATDPKWHPAILKGLLGSAFDVYGALDRDQARRVLARLQVPGDQHGLAELQAKLGV